jgi:hypothetical protein
MPHHRFFIVNTTHAVTLFTLLVVASCSATKNYNPEKKLGQNALQKDFKILEGLLQKNHPALYWYTPKDSMDAAFAQQYALIKDSMTEHAFAWQIIAPTLSQIHCGHTSVSMSNAYYRWANNKVFPAFPLYLKVWADSAMVLANQNLNDSLIKRGTFITAINNKPISTITNTIFNHLSTDGFSNGVHYSRISNNFPAYHRNIFGLRKMYSVSFINAQGNIQTTQIPWFVPTPDSTKKSHKPASATTQTRAQRRYNYRQTLRRFAIDTVNNVGLITLNTFSNGRLRKFFKNTFKYIRKNNIQNVVLDMRLNGGGKVIHSNTLLRYIANKKFKIADTTTAVARNFRPYTKYVKYGFWHTLGLQLLTRKHANGQYYRNFRTVKPKRHNHFNGNMYILTAGPTFSAASIVCNIVRPQKNITLVGEETGGGWYGNSGIFIPDITLPHSKLKVRLPLFKMVQYNHVATKGTGVLPEYFVPTDYKAILNNYDKKMQIAYALIAASKTNN